MRHRDLLPLLVVVACGCDRCDEARERVERELSSPDPGAVSRLVGERLKTDRDIAKQACGLESASGLDVDKVTVAPGMYAGIGHAEVRAKPIDPKAKAGVALDRALVCVAVLAVTFKAVTRDEQGYVSVWELRSVELDEVKTPGAEWRRAVESYDD